VLRGAGRGLTSVRRTGAERSSERIQTPATAIRHLALVQRNLDLMGCTTTMYLHKIEHVNEKEICWTWAYTYR
jgi:hypothetical protein